MSYDNFEHSCHGTLSRGYSYGMNERLELRNEEVCERNGRIEREREQDLDQGEEPFK